MEQSEYEAEWSKDEDVKPLSDALTKARAKAAAEQSSQDDEYEAEHRRMDEADKEAERKRLEAEKGSE